jgi:RHS repeat-associated protein
VRSYYAEGEYLSGAPPQALYYGIDKLASIRRVFASPSTAPAYGFDPYGVPLQATTPVTDFVYAGMFFNADSGLYLARYRTYDSPTGRWLSRDLLGEATDAAANLYSYVAGSPLSSKDPAGLLPPSPQDLPEPPPLSQSCNDDGGSGPLLAQIPPTFFPGRLPPVVGPRPVTPPPEPMPPGSAGGPGAGKAFPRSFNKEQPEGTPCVYCGEPTTQEPGPNQLNGDHVIPKSRGGNNSPENYAPSCRTCNLEKGARTPEEWGGPVY